MFCPITLSAHVQMSQGETKFKFMIFLRQGHNTITVNQAIKEERIINALLV
jgi:hypothetical protein